MRGPDEMTVNGANPRRGGSGLAWIGIVLLVAVVLAVIAHFSPDAGDLIGHIIEAIVGVIVGIFGAVVGILAAIVGVLAGVVGLVIGLVAAAAGLLIAILPFLVPVVILVAIGIAIGRSRRKS